MDDMNMGIGFSAFQQMNQNMDSAGNIVASIMSNSGNGAINQGSDANGAANNFVNSVAAGPNGEENVQTVAGNQEAQLRSDKGSDIVNQNEDGNHNANKMSNHVVGGNAYSVVTFNVGNQVAKAANATGNEQIAQTKDNNNASNVFLNN